MSIIYKQTVFLSNKMENNWKNSLFYKLDIKRLILLSVNIKDLEQVFKQGNVFQIILNLVIQNGNKITKAAMVKELQTHPVSGNFIHIDFMIKFNLYLWESMTEMSLICSMNLEKKGNTGWGLVGATSLFECVDAAS